MPDNKNVPAAAPPNPGLQRLFLLGFSLSGEDYLERLFVANYYRARLWMGGRLARDLAYSARSARVPFTFAPNAQLFGRMECLHLPHLPRIAAPAEAAYLRQYYPNAVFVLNYVPVEDWIAARLAFADGLYLRQDIYHLRTDRDGVIAHWRAEHETHHAAIRAEFAQSDRFLECQADADGLAALVPKLSPWFEFDVVPDPAEARESRLRGVMSPNLGQGLPLVVPDWKRATKPAPDPALCDQIASFCLSGTGAEGLRQDRLWHWDGRDHISAPDGETLPMLRAKAFAGQFIAAPQRQREARVQGVVNELIGLGRAGPVTLDLRDARRQGHGPDRTHAHPVLCYNRRPGAGNMVLWPLPGYHTPGLPTYVASAPTDPAPFSQKQDICVWRGALTGASCRELLPEGMKSLSVQRILPRIEERRLAGQSYEQELVQLRAVPRFALAETRISTPGFDVGLVIGPGYGLPYEAPEIMRLRRDAHPVSWFHQARYVLSISGYDTGSNFLMAAHSNALVLREEDGWELFYSALFKPWEHYVPLARGLTDLDEKLDWARSNPGICAQISAAASDLCLKIADPANRRRFLTSIADGLGLVPIT